MNEKILNLSKTKTSFEIARELRLSLQDVEEALVNYYYKSNWILTKDEILEIASKIYFSSPTVLSNYYDISEPTIKNISQNVNYQMLKLLKFQIII